MDNSQKNNEKGNQKLITQFFDVLEEELLGLYGAIKASTDSIVLLDLECQIKELNQSAGEMQDVPDKNDLAGKDFSEFFIAEDKKKFRDDFAKVKKGESSKIREYQMKVKGNQVIPVEISLSPVKDSQDKIIGVVTICRDISLRKQTEKKLREQVHFLQQLIDNIPSPIFYKNSEGLYLGCNKAFEKYIGMEREEVIGKSVFDISPKKLAQKYYEMDSALLKKGGVQVYEFSVRYADGTLHDVIFHKGTFRNIDGEIAGLVGVFEDITEFKKLEKKVKE